MRLLGALLLVPLALASPAAHPRQVIAPRASPSAASKPQPQNGVLRLPMRRRAPSQVLTTMPILAEATKTHHHTTHTSSTPSPVTVNVTGLFKDVAYGVKIWIGEPEQAVTLDFDTGSSETWVDPPCTNWEGMPDYEDLCRALGIYMPQQSDTGIDLNGTCPPRWITYGSGAAQIRYYKDVVNFLDPWDFESTSSFRFKKPVQFGVATWSQNMVSGILGAAYARGYNQKYSGFIDEIYDQGLVLDKDFSIALGSVSEGEGELVFGGVDLSKFIGPLHELDLAEQYSEEDDGYYRYWINVTSIGVTAPGTCEETPLTNSTFTEKFLPDTGTTLTYLPEEAFYGILNFFPDAKPEPGYGYSISCSNKDKEGTVDFGFGDFTIHVPFSEFIFEIPATFSNDGKAFCVIGAVPAASFYILGDTFLRAAYAVFSQQRHKIYLAQFVNCGTDVVSSHGNMTKLVGNCGHRRPFAPPTWGPSSESSSHASVTISASANATSAVPSATPIGFGTCRSFSTGTYSTMGYASLNSLNAKVRHDRSMFPLPRVQTVVRDKDGKPVADPTAAMATVTGSPSPTEAVRTTVATSGDVAVTTTYSINQRGTSRGPGANTASNSDSWSNYSFDLTDTAATVVPFTATHVTTIVTTAPGHNVPMTEEESSTSMHSESGSSSSFDWSSFYSSISTRIAASSSRFDSSSSYPSDSASSSISATVSSESFPPASETSESWTSDASTSYPSSGGMVSPISSSTSYDSSYDWTDSTSASSTGYGSSSDAWSAAFTTYSSDLESWLSPTGVPTSYPSESFGSFSISWESTPSVTVITIPIESDETVIVQMRTTTYSIVDGTTVAPESASETASESASDSASDSASEGPCCHHHTTSSVSGTAPLSTGGYGTGTGSHTGSISYTETGVWKNSTTSSKRRHSTLTPPSSTSESTTNIDGYITGWSWTPLSAELAQKTPGVGLRGGGGGPGSGRENRVNQRAIEPEEA